MFIEQSNYRYQASEPQSEVSETLPNQTVDLSILVKQLMQGKSLNVGLSMTSTPDSDFDTPDLSKMDYRHMSASDVDRLMPEIRRTLRGCVN